MGKNTPFIPDILKSQEACQKLLSKHACPTINKALPSHPQNPEEKSYWFGLHENFLFKHHSSFRDKLENNKGFHENITKLEQNLFCVYEPESRRLESLIRKSRGGSVLITGYRGTGKSSLANYTISIINEKDKDNVIQDPPVNYITITINLSTSRTAEALADMMIKEINEKAKEGIFKKCRILKTNPDKDLTSDSYEKIKALLFPEHTERDNIIKRSKYYFHSIKKELNCRTVSEKDKNTHLIHIIKMYQRVTSSMTSSHSESRHRSASIGASLGSGELYKPLYVAGTNGQISMGTRKDNSQSLTQLSYTLHEKQQDLHICLNLLNERGFRLIFIFDELDKLTPRDTDAEVKHYTEKLIDIQNIAADLKFLLTESNAHNIFIAGKDVDESWQEDQNKGEGLFESVFVQNIYIPSTLTAKLKPTLGFHGWLKLVYHGNIKTKDDIEGLDDPPLEWKSSLFTIIMNELGIDKNSWIYNTGLLIIPHFSQNEICRILLRVIKKQNNPRYKTDSEMELCLSNIREDYKNYKLRKNNNRNKWPDHPMTERSVRRLRTLLAYLTYKGRGIPRKILREFYTLVQDKDTQRIKDDEKYLAYREVHKYIISLPLNVRQKMNFFANLVFAIDSNREYFQHLDDKGCVATFHIIDYILKFYQTGFSWSDIEHAGFMTLREELFPSRELVIKILGILEDRLIERVDRRQRKYMLLPRAKHDLAGLYMAFGPEQIELRFTKTEFAAEIKKLEAIVSKVESTEPNKRLESFKSQIRLGEIYEDLENHFDAKLAYSKALRWIRMDIYRILSTKDETNPTIDSIKTANLITYVSSACQILQQLGYLYELDREFRTALQYYEEAVRFHEITLVADDKEKIQKLQSVLGEKTTSGALIERHRDRRRNHTPIEAHFLNSHPKFLNYKNYHHIIESMLPDPSWKEIIPFTVPEITTNKLKTIKYKYLKPGKHSTKALYTAHEPHGFPLTLNMLAINLEKMWHRFACNKFLLIALDYYYHIGDEYGKLDQLVFIGELALRRRDVRLATAWYLLALAKISKFQNTNHPDETAKIPEQQSSKRARLYEYLGDVLYATNGTSILRTDEIEDCVKENKFEKILSDKIVKLHKELHLKIFDDRNFEYFYSQAGHHYLISNQILRDCDVYLKKLTIRTDLFIKKLNMLRKTGDLQESLIGKYKRKRNGLTFGDLVKAWCAFWSGAEKIINLLIDKSASKCEITSIDTGYIIDSRRFGVLFNKVGIMLNIISGDDCAEQFYSWIWEPDEVQKNWEINEYITKKNYLAKLMNRFKGKKFWQEQNMDYGMQEAKRHIDLNSDIQIAASTIKRIIGIITDNYKYSTENTDAGENDICHEDEVGIRSPLWGLAAYNWLSNKGNLRDTAFPGLKNKPNTLLFGILYYIAVEAKEKFSFLTDPYFENEISKIVKTIRLVYRSELLLFGGYLWLDDNIRDIDSAQASRSLGVLYLRGINLLLQIRHFLHSQLNKYPYNDEYQYLLDHFDVSLACTFECFYSASKRFLENAISIYTHESANERCFRQILGSTYRALGDLLLIRAEMLHFHKDENDTAIVTDTSGKITVEGLLEPWPSVKKILSGQTYDPIDTETFNVRRECSEAYRASCKQILTEMEEYTKRYKFPHEAYCLHRNIMDTRLHFLICSNIRNRHWDYINNPKDDGEKAFGKLNLQMWHLTLIMNEKRARIYNRDKWLKDIKNRLDWANALCTAGQYFSIKELEASEITKKNGDDLYRVSYREDANTLNIPAERHFFRSFKDGISTKPKK